MFPQVGIIDTGVDYMHPALGGGFGSGFKVAYGYDFVGDLYGSTNSSEESTIMQPDNDPVSTRTASAQHVLACMHVYTIHDWPATLA